VETLDGAEVRKLLGFEEKKSPDATPEVKIQAPVLEIKTV